MAGTAVNRDTVHKLRTYGVMIGSMRSEGSRLGHHDTSVCRAR